MRALPDGRRDDPSAQLRPRPVGRRLDPVPRYEPALAGRSLTPEQLSAVRAIMRLFVDDDLARGISPARRLRCAACEEWKSAPGSILYERLEFCNGCATDFEIARLRGLVRTAAEYLSLQPHRASA